MKKIIISCVLVLTFVLISPSGNILAEESQKEYPEADNHQEEEASEENDKDPLIVLEKEEVELDPIIQEGRTYIPVRKLSEELGADVEYISEDRRINIYYETMEINMWVDTHYTIVNNKETETDSPVFIEEDRSYAPLRFLAEWFGYEVKWSEEDYSITLKTPEEEVDEEEVEEVEYKEPEFEITLEDKDIFIDMSLKEDKDSENDSDIIDDEDITNEENEKINYEIIKKHHEEDKIKIYFPGEKYKKTLEPWEIESDPLLNRISVEPLYEIYQKEDNNTQEERNNNKNDNNQLEEKPEKVQKYLEDKKNVNKLTIELVYPIPEDNVDIADKLKEKSMINTEIHRIFREEKRKEVETGLEYVNVRKGKKDGPLNINKLYYDPFSASLVADLVIAEDKIEGLESIKDMSERKEATAAINGGYFHWQGNPLGLTIRDGLLITRPTDNASAFIMDSERKSSKIKPVSFGSDHKLIVNEGQLELEIDSLNRSFLNDREAVVYTSEFADNTEEIYEDDNNDNNNDNNENNEDKKERLEIVVEKGEVIEVNTENSDIPYYGYVISISKNHSEFEKFKDIEKGDHTWLSWDFEGDFAMEDVSFALGAGPGLVEEGEKYVRVDEEDVAANIREGKNPRTAIGVMPEGELLLMVVDGRNPEISMGMELDDLAKYLEELGTTSAMNLDGGASSQMWLEDEIINYPSGSDLRNIGNSIVIK